MANGLNGFCVREELKLWEGLVQRGDIKRAHDGHIPVMNCHAQKVNLALALSLSCNTGTRGLVMKEKGSRMEALKENKYLCKCIINLWSEFLQEWSEAKSSVGSRGGLGASVGNENIWSRVGWCGEREGTAGTGKWHWQQKPGSGGRNFHN